MGMGELSVDRLGAITTFADDGNHLQDKARSEISNDAVSRDTANRRKLQLLKASRDTVAASLFGIPLVVLAFWNNVDHLRLLPWGVVAWAIAWARLAATRIPRGAEPAPNEIASIHARNMTGIGMASLLWVVGAVVLYSSNTGSLTLLAVLYLGVGGAATWAFSCWRRAFTAFVLPVMAAIVCVFLYRAATIVTAPQEPGVIALALAAAGTGLWRIMTLLHRQFGRMAELEALNERMSCDLLDSETRVQNEKNRQVDRRQSLERIAAEFEAKLVGILDKVADGARQLRETADSLLGNAEQTNRRTMAVAEATSQATGNVQTVASAAEELAASIREIDRQVSHSTEIAVTAVEESRQTDDVVRGLADATQQIGTVVSLITSIAARTNLLALNASIEATRAGEAGKGFAVVAGEVKQLANQTANATKEIAQHIESVQERTATAVDAIGRVASTIGEISSISSAIAAAVEQQTAATQEIARNVQQAANGTQQVSENIQEVSGAANATGQAAGNVLNSADSLAAESAQVRSEVKDFLTKIKMEDIAGVVHAATELIARIGLEESKKTFNADGEFKYGEIYVCVTDFRGTRLCYPPKPEDIGMNVSDVVSVDGKYIVRDIIDIVRKQNEGWTEYAWLHPRKKTNEPKITFAKKVPGQDLIVYIGAYKA